ncbi:MAG TPA: TlpA disulfide reductase family protein [Candidatus Angelobacter sp.]|jgi:peroxiredoxin
MNNQKAIWIFLAMFVIASAVALPSVPVPSKSPEFTISEPTGKNILLSSLKGKVVVMEFLFIKSEHCMRVARTLNELNDELGPQGLQAVGVVFDPPSPSPVDANVGSQMVSYMVDYLKLKYPVGYATKGDVDAYLDRSGTEVLNIPQVVVIDRTGTIRAASGGRGGDPRLEDKDSLSALVRGLLKEGASGNSKK